MMFPGFFSYSAGNSTRCAFLTVIFLTAAVFPQRPLPRVTGLPVGAAGWAAPLIVADAPVEEVARSITRALADSGYLDVAAAVSGSPAAGNLLIAITPAMQYTISKVAVKDSSGTAEEALLPLYALRGSVYSSASVERAVFSVMQGMEARGFPFTRVSVAGITRDTLLPGKCTVSFLVNTGFRAVIDSIAVTGNTVTRDYVILRELGFSTGTLYNPALLRVVPARLNRLRFFSPVKEPRYVITAGQKGVVEVQVEEGVANTFDGVIGYLPPSQQGGKGYFTGLANLAFRNLFGTGRSASFRWQRLNAATEDLQLAYQEPWVLGFPVAAALTVLQFKQDSTYIRRTVEAGIEYFFTRDFSLAARFGSEATVPTTRAVPAFTVFNTSLLTASVVIKYDTRDDPIAPGSGMLAASMLGAAKKKINGPAEYITPQVRASYSVARGEAFLRWYASVAAGQVIALSLSGKSAESPLLEVSDLYRLGGNASLRGYRENQFLANRIVTGSVEYRYLTGGRAYLFLFSDFGYFYRKELSLSGLPGEEQNLAGYGAGLTTETGIGLLSVSYALGKGDGFSQGKIHFGIINQF